MLLICKIFDESYIFSIKDQTTIIKIIDLIKTMYGGDDVLLSSDIQIIVAEEKWQPTKHFYVSDLAKFLQMHYKDHIEELNEILRKLDAKYYQKQGYTKKDYSHLNEDIFYHTSVVKKIKSICRLNSISLAEDNGYQDVMFRRVPGSVFQ